MQILNHTGTNYFRRILFCFLSGLFLPGIFLCLAAAGPCKSDPASTGVDERPNILFIFGEDWGLHTGAYGNKIVKTPVFDRMAEEGVLFTHAFCTAPSCSPSKASVLTGQVHWRLGASVSHSNETESMLNARYHTYVDELIKSGYVTAYTGKGGWKSVFNKQPELSGRSHNPAGSVSIPFEEFLKNHSRDKPFCYWQGGGYAHRQFNKGSGLESGKKMEDVNVPPCWPDVPEIRSDILDYYQKVEDGDRSAGKAIELLEEYGLLEKTIVVISGDHGWSFPRGKANVYDMGLRVPLVIRWGSEIRGPEVAGGRVVDDLVSLQDLAPTFLEAASLEALPEMTAMSLMNILQSGKEGLVDATRTEVYAGLEVHVRFYPMRAIRTRDYLLIHNFLYEDAYGGAGVDRGPTKQFIWIHREDEEYADYFKICVGPRPEFELYHIPSDQHQLTNLADDPSHKSEFEALKKKMEDYLVQTKDPRISQKGPVSMLYFDERASKRLKTLN